MNKRFRHVAVLKGGPSSEREVSLVSGAAVARGLRACGYAVTELDVPGSDFALPEPCDAVFIALHGPFGEDGTVQDILEMRGVPYTGSGPEASRRAIDKCASKRIFEAAGVPTAAFEVLAPGARPTMPYPLVIKPPLEGSTIGIHRVEDAASWDAAAADCLRYGDSILAEAYLPGVELTVGILQGEALPIIQIEAPGTWYDYDAKYLHRVGETRYLVPAPLQEELAATCRDIALRAFDALGCRSFGRVDLRFSAAGEPNVLEVNTIPGFTEGNSLLPKAAEHAGIAFPLLCDRILQDARLT